MANNKSSDNKISDKKDANKDNSSDTESSADNVEQHLKQLAKSSGGEQLYNSQEQPFSSEELASVINEQRLNELLAQSDAFLDSLSGEIEDFDEEDFDEDDDK